MKTNRFEIVWKERSPLLKKCDRPLVYLTNREDAKKAKKQAKKGHNVVVSLLCCCKRISRRAIGKRLMFN
ncbi:MAG: hypothetical protein HC849_04415 [Oscillatoriales cyanobacterium RU_3_3]|nr:hypothetical protein [Microcoleus sp. SU_5_6]NJL67550.1 hypothetical protein [Microcoleus sp. SM1_3_4]NJM59603.1 hypothetical protein [Oscillatoriales cyanobacterium RU_3_3]NJR23735.1 hypothetical protein [Richelia sp. CSU_2_1]